MYTNDCICVCIHRGRDFATDLSDLHNALDDWVRLDRNPGGLQVKVKHDVHTVAERGRRDRNSN